MTEKENLRH